MTQEPTFNPPTHDNMENNKLTIEQRFRRLVNMGHDKAPEEEIIRSIEEGIEFHGAKLWILVIAIFVASLGLNTNSAAVIIGAMLISPLMGPIIGMGLGVGVYDFELFKRAIRNYLVTTLFSVTTATVYFLISPLTEAQSELLARTSPTIYDVGIALCGGLAGIIALSSRSQRTGNVIPGVAIATALMPPLCTVGYGIALGNFAYAAGALYLYLINTVFIALSTTLGVTLILKLHKKQQVDKKRATRVRHSILAIALVTMIPSIYLTLGILRSTMFERQARLFVQNEMKFNNARVLSTHADAKHNQIQVVMIGQPVDTILIRQAADRLPQYHLNETRLDVVQSGTQMDENEICDIVNGIYDRRINRQTEAEKRINELELAVARMQQHDKLSATVFPELKTLFPQVGSLSILQGRTAYSSGDSITTDSASHIAVIHTTPLNADDETRMTQWLRQRTGISRLQILSITKP